MQRPTRPKNTDAVPAFLKSLGVSPAEWQYTAKADLRYFMRPGNTLRVRVAACLIAQSSGYRRDVCVLQVKGDSKKEGPKLLPLWPGAIEKILRRAAIDAYQESGVELTDEQRNSLAIHKGNLHAVLKELEEEDGFICRVRANTDVKKLIQDATPLDEAIKRKLVTPVAELPAKERAQLHGKTLIYKRTILKPATLKALKRLDEEPGEGVKIHSLSVTSEDRRAIQLLFRFLPKAGHPKDPMLTLNLAHRPDVKSALDSYQTTVRTAEESFTAFLATVSTDAAAAVEIPKAGPEIEQRGPQRPAARRRQATAELATIAAAAGRFALCDTDAAAQIARECRKLAPESTVAEIAAAIELKGPLATRKANPIGFLIVAVPRLFEGEGYEQIKAAAAPAAAAGPAVDRGARLAIEAAYDDYRQQAIAAKLAELPDVEQRRKKAEKAVRKQWSHLPAATIAQLTDRQLREQIAAEVNVISFEEFEATQAGRIAAIA